MKGKFLIWGGMLLLLALLPSAAFAAKGLYLGYPIVNNTGNAYSYLEVGAKANIAIKYERTSSDYNAISSAMLYLTYDSSIINKNSIYLTGNFSDYLTISLFTVTDNEIIIQLGLNTARSLGVEPFPIDNDTVLATITFHASQNNGNDGKNLGLKWNIDPALVQVSARKGDGTIVIDKTATNYEGYTPPLSVLMETSVAPFFTGIDGNPSDLTVGNTLNLIWTNNASTAHDKKTGKAETLYPDKKLRYRVYRSVGGSAFNNDINIKILDNSGPTTYQDGPATGVPALTNPLNDGTKYWYKVKAIDDVYNDALSSNPNEQLFTDVAEGSGVPTDTTPPGNGSLAVSPGDSKLLLSWTPPSDADYDGVVIIKNVGKAVGAGTLVGANATTFAHGQICSVGQEPFGAGNGAVFYVGKTPPTEDAGLVNGTVYYYKAFAYDKADGNYPSDLVQMGRNYTSGVVAQAAPGLQPDAVTDFYAISRLAENEITLNWKNSNNPAKPQGGTVVWYTAKVDKWDQIPEDTTKWTNETAMTAIKLFAIQAKSGPEELLRLSQDASGTALTTKETYFFKAFAYNETGTPLTPADLLDPVKISSYRFSSGVKAAGAPTVGGLSLLSDKKAYRLKLKKKTGDFGINFVVFPFSPNDTIWCYNETTSKDDPVLMLTKLRDIIRDKGAKVITLGWWGPDQKPLGYIFNNDGKITWRKEGTPENFDGLKMIWNVPYQISVVDKDVEIILKNYSGAPEPGNIIEPGDVESGMSGGTSPGAP